MESTPAPSPYPKHTLVLLVAAIVLPAGLNLWLYWTHNPLYGHGLWVLPLAGLLVWRRLDGVEPATPVWESAPKRLIVLCLAAMPLIRVVQIANPDWRLLDWALLGLAVVALLALSYRLGGHPALAALWFPICFLLTSAPWSTSVERAFTNQAVPFTAMVASEALWTVGVAVVDEGRMIRTTAGPLEVSEDCSGIRGVQLAVMGALFWAGWLRFRAGRTLALLAGGLAVALLLNVSRVIALVVVVQRTGRIDAAESWHDPLGSAAQCALVLALPALAWLLRDRVPSAPDRNYLPPAPWGIVPLSAALGAVCWIGLGEATGEWWFRRHEDAKRDSALRWTISRPVPIAGAKEEPIAGPVRQNYRYSDGLSLAWNDARGTPWALLWMEFERSAQSACAHNVHRPEWCLPAQGCKLVREFAPLNIDALGRTIPFRHQFYLGRDQGFHLFFTTVQDTPAGGERSYNDWTLEGRLHVAWLGVRSQRSQMVHLTRSGNTATLQAREEAKEYLQQLIVPVSAPEKKQGQAGQAIRYRTGSGAEKPGPSISPARADAKTGSESGMSSTD